MSSATLSSSPGPSEKTFRSKRTLPGGDNAEERGVKRSRTESNAKRDAKDKKKRQKRKKRKHSVVVIEDGHARDRDTRHGVSSFLENINVVPMASPAKAGEFSRNRSKSASRVIEPVSDTADGRDNEEPVTTPKVSR